MPPPSRASALFGHRIRWNKRAASEVLYVQAFVRGAKSGQIDGHRQQFQTTGL
jgi:hypothetical protein